MEKKIILQHNEIEAKIKRIAFQIYEGHWQEKQLVVIGIQGSGNHIAGLLAREIENISPIKTTRGAISIDKREPLKHVECSLKPEELKGKHIVLVDDVLNSGKVLIYAAKFLLQAPLESLKTAVIIDRNHKKFPIKADYKGLSLSTSLNDRVNLIIEPDGKMYGELL